MAKSAFVFEASSSREPRVPKCYLAWANAFLWRREICPNASAWPASWHASATQGAKAGDLYLRNPEAWLESQVRRNLEKIDPSIFPSPGLRPESPAFAAGDRGIIDLLACGRTGRLAVIELKASADLHLPLQALDYWMRVHWHLMRDEFGQHGYFPGVPLNKEPPRLLLVCPRTRFSSDDRKRSQLRFSPTIEVEAHRPWNQLAPRSGCDVPASRLRAARLIRIRLYQLYGAFKRIRS